MTTESKKKKITVLGGGMAALSAVHELTDYPGWKDRYEITVYQIGWRLGGKTATGRGNCNRIEEHGIHILQGWYDTTFRLLRDVYKERKTNNLAPDSPLQDLFKDGLKRNNTTLMTDFDVETGKWTNWPLIFPQLEDLPGDGEPLSTWELIEKGIAMMLEIALGSPYRKGINPISKWILDHYFPSNGEGGLSEPKKKSFLERVIEFFISKKTQIEQFHQEKYDGLVESLDITKNKTDSAAYHRLTKALGILRKIVGIIEKRELKLMGKRPALKRINLMIALAYYNLKGVLEDVYDPRSEKFDFNRINDIDYREWLRKQGAPDWVVFSVVVRFFYTGTFANLVNEKGGAIGAGTALEFFTKSVGYKGSFVFQFVYGTGDVMVMPMYEVLKNRGVEFKFFQEIKQIHYSDTGAIQKISLAEQVKLNGATYDPVKKIGDLNAWPSVPNYEQIDPGYAKRLIDGQVNLEDPWANWTNYQDGTLNLGVDFDEVILGIPIGTLKTICSEIIEKQSKWKLMVDNVLTTPTISSQLWFLPKLKELGFELAAWGLPEEGGAPNVVVYQNPMYSWLDSSLVLPNEDWPAGQKPEFLAYFTGPLTLRAPLPPFTDHNFQKKETQRLIDSFEQWLNDNAGWFWPKGATETYPQGLDFQLLADPENNKDGFSRFVNQYFRANVRPTDHYTLSVPNSHKYRLKTDQSGFSNLFMCGDWIDFGANVGYIDGAIQSGLQAGQALRLKLGLGNHKVIWR
ncbi:NAD(P)-binding protein [Algoriphagus jejuensis]|uniref:NAD(P)-binding protein n=1 Tax=Algoriphagus jejuensis TaxID=419934 RepID=A0ABP3YCH0_9BACT